MENQKKEMCIGYKLENGKKCLAPKSSYSQYCIHHIDTFEVLTEYWIKRIEEAILQFVLSSDNNHVSFEIRKYATTHINWFMALSEKCPWYYPYSGNYTRKYGYTGTLCTARRLKDGSECTNPKSKESLCQDCYIIQRILHHAYKIASASVYDEIEMVTVENNEKVTKTILCGTKAYVEYCSRQEYEAIFRMLTEKGHRERFWAYLAPYIFNHPYPIENLKDVDPDFILRYVKTTKEIQYLEGKKKCN
jgi:hypothetical protein